MAREVLNNGESGLDIRTKINGNFEELYARYNLATLGRCYAIPSNSWGGYGLVATVNGTSSNVADANDGSIPLWNLATAASSNSDASFNGGNIEFIIPADANVRMPLRSWQQIVAFPDADYGAGATGSRICVGACPQIAAMVGGAVGSVSDNNARACWFRYDTSAGDVNWQFIRRTTSDVASAIVTDTGIPFAAGGAMFHFGLFVEAPNQVRWAIGRVGASGFASDVVNSNLPTNLRISPLRATIRTLSAVARNIRAAEMAMFEAVL